MLGMRIARPGLCQIRRDLGIWYSRAREICRRKSDTPRHFLAASIALRTPSTARAIDLEQSSRHPQAQLASCEADDPIGQTLEVEIDQERVACDLDERKLERRREAVPRQSNLDPRAEEEQRDRDLVGECRLTVAPMSLDLSMPTSQPLSVPADPRAQRLFAIRTLSRPSTAPDPSEPKVARRPSSDSGDCPADRAQGDRALGGVWVERGDSARTISRGAPRTTSCGSIPISINRCSGMAPRVVEVARSATRRDVPWRVTPARSFVQPLLDGAVVPTTAQHHSQGLRPSRGRRLAGPRFDPWATLAISLSLGMHGPLCGLDDPHRPVGS
jgi:hypothetical protein